MVISSSLSSIFFKGAFQGPLSFQGPSHFPYLRLKGAYPAKRTEVMWFSCPCSDLVPLADELHETPICYYFNWIDTEQGRRAVKGREVLGRSNSSSLIAMHLISTSEVTCSSPHDKDCLFLFLTLISGQKSILHTL